MRRAVTFCAFELITEKKSKLSSMKCCRSLLLLLSLWESRNALDHDGKHKKELLLLKPYHDLTSSFPQVRRTEIQVALIIPDDSVLGTPSKSRNPQGFKLVDSGPPTLWIWLELCFWGPQHSRETRKWAFWGSGKPMQGNWKLPGDAPAEVELLHPGVCPRPLFLLLLLLLFSLDLKRKKRMEK